MSKSGGVFQIDDVTRTMSKGGGVRLVFHPSKFRPPTWLAGYGPARPISHNSFPETKPTILENSLQALSLSGSFTLCGHLRPSSGREHRCGNLHGVKHCLVRWPIREMYAGCFCSLDVLFLDFHNRFFDCFSCLNENSRTF